MNNKDNYMKVFEFMVEKDRIILEKSGLHIFDKELFRENFNALEDAEHLEEFIRRMHYRGKKVQEEMHDGILCPWCTKYYKWKSFSESKIACAMCPFGEKYGVCNEEDSLYTEIKENYFECGELFSEMPEMQVAIAHLIADYEE